MKDKLGTNVRLYTDKELLEAVKKHKDFVSIPQGYWLLCIRSSEDENDAFDDKFYLFKGEEFIMLSSGTTNKGNKGTAVILPAWHYEKWARGLHRGKVSAYVQIADVDYARDFTNDEKTNPTSGVYQNVIGVNIHPADYDLKKKIVKKNIGGWSEGCLVWNNIPDYVKFLDFTKEQKKMTVCLMNEF